MDPPLTTIKPPTIFHPSPSPAPTSPAAGPAPRAAVGSGAPRAAGGAPPPWPVPASAGGGEELGNMDALMGYPRYLIIVQYQYDLMGSNGIL